MPISPLAPPNQSLKLTAEAEARQKVEHGGQVQTRYPQENWLVLACAPPMRKRSSEGGGESWSRRSLAPIR